MALSIKNQNYALLGASTNEALDKAHIRRDKSAISASAI